MGGAIMRNIGTRAITTYTYVFTQALIASPLLCPLVVSSHSSYYNNTEAGTNELRFDWSRFTWTLLKDLITNAYLPANEK